MRIITNADDFGQSTELVKATIECFQDGSLTSATIMASMAATDQAVAFAKANPQFSYGVHLTYVLGDQTERPICDPRTLPTLCAPDGRFRESDRIRILALTGRVPEDEIARETEAQLSRIRDLGVSISHVDSHGHLHRFGPFRRALRRVLPRFGISRVRSSQDTYLRPRYRSPNYWIGPHWRRALMSAFRTTQHFYMPTSAGDVGWTGPLLELIAGDSIEIGVHPGYSEAWRSGERQELQLFAGAARGAGHQFIGWKEL